MASPRPAVPVLGACGVGGRTNAPNGADDVTGGFDWKKASGHDDQHPADAAPVPEVLSAAAQGVHRAHRNQRQRRPGARGRLLHQAQHRTGGRHRQARRVHARCLLHLAVRARRLDRETSTRGCRTRSATGPDYDFEDIFDGLRTSTRWDFTTGDPLGTGGQWAIPWGFENNVVAYNKKYFDQRGIKKLPDRFDDFIQLAVDLTDRSAEPLRHRHPRFEVLGHDPSRLHDAVHPGGRGRLHVQRLGADRRDGQRQGDRIHQEVDRDAAQGRADILDRLRVSQCHRRSR